MVSEDGITRWPENVEDLIPFESLKSFRRIGLGGFGCVYRAKLEGHPRQVAVKVLAVSTANVTEMFVQEAAVLRMVDHENIVKFIGLVNIPQGVRNIAESADGPRLAFVEEYLEGGTVMSLMMKQMISPFNDVYSLEMALDFCLGIANALSYLHNLRPLILHRDLTPDNIVITNQGGKLCAKLIDFGLTMLIDTEGKPVDRLSAMQFTKEGTVLELGALKELNMEQDHEPDSGADTVHSSLASSDGNSRIEADGSRDFQEQEIVNSVLSEANQLLQESQKKKLNLKNIPQVYNITGQTGSYMYMAPEVYRCLPYNESADAFSFGVILYEIFSRNLLVVSETDMQSPIESKLYADRVSNGYQPKIPEKMHNGVRSLIKSCMSCSPQDRPSMKEIVSQLCELKELEEFSLPAEVSCCRCM